jgi:hypothetical protein
MINGADHPNNAATDFIAPNANELALAYTPITGAFDREFEIAYKVDEIFSTGPVIRSSLDFMEFATIVI